MNDMPRPKPPHLYHEKTRHGSLVWYVRIGHGPRVRIKEDYGTEAFNQAYRDALAGKQPPKGKAKSGTLRWLWERYKDSSAWRDELSAETRRQRSSIMLHVIKLAGDQPLSRITRKTIIDGRERRKGNAKRHFVQAMRGLFKWGLDAELVTSNPTDDVKVKREETDGFHTWTEEECARFEKRWPLGTRERLAYDVLLYTGLRRGDAVQLGRQHVKNGVATIKTEKTGTVVIIPILPPLQASIDATPRKGLTFIETAFGRPMKKESFGTWFRLACDAAEVPGSAHGLRKAGATRAANEGATPAQLDAMYGWTGGRMAALYTRKVDRERLAREAAERVAKGAGASEKSHSASKAQNVPHQRPKTLKRKAER